MIKLAVVGKNIGYSKSPFIHTEFAKALGLQVDYTLADVGESSFADKIKSLQQAGFTGCNITVPFKEEAYDLADEKSPAATQAGAANTFVFSKDGSIFADNTDGVGLVRDITENIGFALQDKTILICGAGGAVRGILGPLLATQPCKLVIANRTAGKLEACTYERLAGQAFDVVIDGTSLKTEPLPLPDSLRLNNGALVYDLKYSPGQPTLTTQWAQQKGAAHIHDGIGMLVEQAAEAFKIWIGVCPDTSKVLKML